MTGPGQPARVLGTMIAYGFPRGELKVEFDLVERLGATLLEILPCWEKRPDPKSLRERVEETGRSVWSVHGCWGSQTIRAEYVDLGSLEEKVRRASVDDIKECLDWLTGVGGRCLVIHPGGLSWPEEARGRRQSLAESLQLLADHANDLNVLCCVENMPPGVHPGSRMAELKEIVTSLDTAEIGLALDTGHANMVSDVATEASGAGVLLRTTHVHDNDGRRDTHDPPGHGTIDWELCGRALDRIDYDGPIMLECIRQIRQDPQRIDDRLRESIKRLIERETV